MLIYFRKEGSRLFFNTMEEYTAVHHHMLVTYEAITGYCVIFIHLLQNSREALQPPNPDAIFKHVFIVTLLSLSMTAMGCVTPIEENPRVLNNMFRRREFMAMTDSIIPAAPNVCPQYPFRLFTGISCKPALEMAIASISSLDAARCGMPR